MIHSGFEELLFDKDMPVKAMVQRLNRFHLHWHSNPELLYIVKGSVLLHVDGEDFLLREGNMMYINVAEAHSIHSTDEHNLLIALQFDIDFFQVTPNLKTSFFRHVSFFEDQKNGAALCQRLATSILSLVLDYNKRAPGYRYAVAAHAHMILSTLIRANYFFENPQQLHIQNHVHQQINEILDYIKLHYTEDLTLKTIADAQHISYFHLSRIFKEVTGITFRQFLTNTRLHHAQKELLNTKESILSIALSNGFASSKSFNIAFGEQYGMHPSEYRRRFSANPNAHPDPYALGNENNLLYLSVNSEEDLSLIYEQVEALYNQSTRLSEPVQGEVHAVAVDTSDALGSLRHTWSSIGCCARAADLLRRNVQLAVARATKELGYRYLRFHGIFCDDMMVFNRNTSGDVVYNWIYVDQVFDFLISLRLHPLLELDFTPSGLATSSNTLFWYGANISFPSNLDIWADMVKALLRHCMERYGYEEVSQWYVEVWNEPDYRDVFFEGTQEDYLALYAASVRAVKSVCPAIRVGGPAITHIHYTTTTWIKQLLDHCREQQLPIDFISCHTYADQSADYSRKDNEIFPKMSKSAHVLQNIESDLIATHKKTMQQSGISPLELLVTEWNISAKARFRLRDIAFMAPYVIYTALQCHDQVDALAFWTVTDLIEELKAPVEPFHGGLGLINIHGIPKPSYWGFYLLHKLGHTIIDQGEGYIVTRDQDVIQVLMYNLFYPNRKAQQNTDFSSEHEKDLYTTMFDSKPDFQFNIQLNGLSGAYRMTHYVLNRQCGGCYELWQRMGEPSDLRKDEIEYLQSVSVPQVSVQTASAENGAITLRCLVPLHGCHLVIVHPTAVKH